MQSFSWKDASAWHTPAQLCAILVSRIWHIRTTKPWDLLFPLNMATKIQNKMFDHLILILESMVAITTIFSMVIVPKEPAVASSDLSATLSRSLNSALRAPSSCRWRREGIRTIETGFSTVWHFHQEDYFRNVTHQMEDQRYQQSSFAKRRSWILYVIKNISVLHCSNRKNSLRTCSDMLGQQPRKLLG